MKYLEHNEHSNKKRYKLCMLLIMCITMTYIAAGCGSKRDGLTITNVSYDPTREFYEEYNKVFADYYMAEYGKQIKVIQSHGGSGSQARSVVEGCNADVVTLALEHDISLIVTPSVSILAQPSVAVVDDNVKVNKTEELASEYLSFLYSKQAQRIAADYGYRPTDEEVLNEYSGKFNLTIKLDTIADYGGWTQAYKIYFDDGGWFDEIYNN